MIRHALPRSTPSPHTLAATFAIVVSIAASASLHAAPPSSGGAAFFETKIRPALVKYCYECHAADSKELGGKLLLDSRDGLRKGGESGPAVTPGKPDASLLIQAIRYDGLEMPPDKPLPETVVADFVKWVERGAVDPRIARPTAGAKKVETASPEERLWSLQPIRAATPPDVRDTLWIRDPIDRFILSRIEAAKLAPNRDADPRTLVRRLHHDLTGLAPSVDDVDEFVADREQRGDEPALESLVDRLLASRQFGERWGRFWLDVARYGESNGNDGLSRNPSFPHAWRYRDYVIGAFNEDLPYDRFLAEQIAGDLLPSDSTEQHDRHLVATGFLAIGSKPAKAMNANFDMDVVADQIDVVGRGVLGLTVGCARCHDHKFDPIPTRDYYSLAGIFTSTETLWGVAGHEGLTAPSTDLHLLKAAPNVPPPDGFVETVLVLESNTGKPKAIPKSKWPRGAPLAMGVRDRAKPDDAKIHVKGEATKSGEAAPRGFLTALVFPNEIVVDKTKSGRLELARWLAHPEHPLTPRVMANRVWQQMFGEGIVRTPDDFGVYGERATHPELLDHLAVRFVSDGWSVKRLVRAIALSRAYRTSSDADPRTIRADAQNLLFARQNRRRLEAESLRDRMLQASGQLDLRPAEGSLIRHRDILVNLAGNLHQPSNHRSVYLCYLRSSPPPELAAFDLPDFTSVTGRRDVSTVPSQALHLFNSPFVIEQAAKFARRAMDETADPLGRVRFAWQRAFGRDPDPEELEQAVALVRAAETELLSEEKGWASLCQALLASNEFRYVD